MTEPTPTPTPTPNAAPAPVPAANLNPTNTANLVLKPAEPASPKPAPPEDKPKDQTFTQADLDKVVAERLTRERGKYQDYDDLKKRAAEWDKHLDAQKTEQQRLTDQLAELQKTASEKDTAVARLMSAATHGIPPDLIDLLGSGTPEEIDQRAKLLAERITAATAPDPAQPVAASTRPVESLRPGAAPSGTAQNGADPNAWLRAIARRQ